MTDLFERVLHCIQLDSPNDKAQCSHQLWRAWQAGTLSLDLSSPLRDYPTPGRPAKPVLVRPRDLPRRSITTIAGRAALLHSLAHIEFNAINLALDAAYRFRDLPKGYYADWLKVAAEEAYHFDLLNKHLQSLGFVYGDFVAHDGLWEMAMRTKDNVLHRMAIIPRGMEARGLDVTPGIIAKLKAAGDEDAIGILNIILRDEIGHVEIGTRWFHYCCDRQKLPRQETFEKLMRRFIKASVKSPLHRSARKSAGFTEAELDFLEGLI